MFGKCRITSKRGKWLSSENEKEWGVGIKDPQLSVLGGAMSSGDSASIATGTELAVGFLLSVIGFIRLSIT